MTFREFLEIKNAQAIVEHIETLSDAEARELIEQLDESTIELIEAILDEGRAELRKLEQKPQVREPTVGQLSNINRMLKMQQGVEEPRGTDDPSSAVHDPVSAAFRGGKSAQSKFLVKRGINPRTGESTGKKGQGIEMRKNPSLDMMMAFRKK